MPPFRVTPASSVTNGICPCAAVHAETIQGIDRIARRFTSRRGRVTQPKWQWGELPGPDTRSGSFSEEAYCAQTPDGRGGIRTHGTLSRTHTFHACALNHSATRPSG